MKRLSQQKQRKVRVKSINVTSKKKQTTLQSVRDRKCNYINHFNLIRVYLLANLTAQRPITKLARVRNNNNNNNNNNNTCRVVRMTKLTGSGQDDWVY
jgi:hypothetical protein